MTSQAGQILLQAKAGNKRAFNILVRQHQERVLYLAYDILGDWDEAKDIAQEAFIKAYQKLDTFEERARFSTWIHRITTNLCIDVQRKRKRHRTESLEKTNDEGTAGLKNELSEDPQIEAMMENAQLRSQLDRALELLSVNQKTAIALRHYQEMSTREISEAMGCSENTVRIHIFRGIKKLKEILRNTQTT